MGANSDGFCHRSPAFCSVAQLARKDFSLRYFYWTFRKEKSDGSHDLVFGMGLVNHILEWIWRTAFVCKKSNW